MGAGWWHSPKVLLAGAACVLGLVCALFVRSAERGEREPRIAPLIREAA